MNIEHAKGKYITYRIYAGPKFIGVSFVSSEALLDPSCVVIGRVNEDGTIDPFRAHTSLQFKGKPRHK